MTDQERRYFQQYAYLSGFAELLGRPAILYFKPSNRHRNWQRSPFEVDAYSPAAFETALKMLHVEGWASIRFVPRAPVEEVVYDNLDAAVPA